MTRKANRYLVAPAAAPAVTLALALALAPAAPPAAQGIDPQPFHVARFGIASLARLQNARLNVVNAGDVSGVDPQPFAPPCRVSLRFLNPGDAVSGVEPQPFLDASGAPIALVVDLRPGESAFLQLTSADVFRGTRELRMPFRAAGLFTDVGAVTPDDGTPDPCAAVVPSLEVYDVLTGRSQYFTHPLEIVGFNPQPEPPVPGAK
jgi:hypothetical protein